MGDDDPLTAVELRFRAVMADRRAKHNRYQRWAEAVAKRIAKTAAEILAARKAKGKSE